jgi:DNA-binding MarR family transcriptional regulator
MMTASSVDPVLAAILWTLWAFAHEAAPANASLARLAKQSDLAMSSLRRGISALEEAGLVTLRVDEKARECALLTDAGRAFCEEVFPQAPD